eukprot:GHVU01083344.1.p1 GENE.GHVU01083344.1~~GHVU01083344.1.p1  ORF type:complete len:116 (+),score=4.42 GHVU01083344.1:39-386(+)
MRLDRNSNDKSESIDDYRSLVGCRIKSRRKSIQDHPLTHARNHPRSRSFTHPVTDSSPTHTLTHAVTHQLPPTHPLFTHVKDIHAGLLWRYLVCRLASQKVSQPASKAATPDVSQ